MTRATTRLVPLALAAIAAALVLRGVAGVGRGADALPGALAYRAVVGVPIAFRLSPEDGDVTVALHLETRGTARPLRFAAALTVEDGAGKPLWHARAVTESAPGALADDRRLLTAPRLITIPDLSASKPARLVVLIEPGDDARAGAPAAIRVSRRAARPPSWHARDPRRDPRTRTAGDLASVFGWEYLSEPELERLHDEPTVRRAAAVEPGLGALVTRVTAVTPALPIVHVEEAGELVGPGAGAVWTVRGPGGLRLRLRGQGAATVRTVDHHGVVVEEPVTVDGLVERGFAAAEGGALSVGVTHREGASFWAVAQTEDGARPLGDAPAPRPDQPLAPDRRRLILWRLAPGGVSLRATLAGDGVARVVARPVDGQAALHWRVVSPGGAVVAAGTETVKAGPAPFERYVDGGAYEPAPLFAAGPPGSRLELSSGDAPVDVALEARQPEIRDGEEVLRLAPAWDLVLGAARVAYAPYLLRRWIPFRPDNHAELTSVTLAAQVRLEPAEPGLPPPGPYRAAEPLAPRIARVLAERHREPGPRREWDRVGFATEQAVPLQVEDRLIVDYLLSPSALGATLAVVVDGAPAAERRVAFARGRVRLDHVPRGRHTVRVDGPPGFVLVSATPGAGPNAPAVFAERRVWRLDRGEAGALVVPVTLAAGQGKTLMFQVYGDEPGPLEARVVIDGAARHAGLRAAAQATRLQRTVVAPAAATTAYWLDGEGGPKTAATFGVRLGPDLGAGTHRVRISLTRGPARAWARFFVTGRADHSPGLRARVEWEGD